MVFQKPFEEGTASRENHFVSFDALILAGQGDIGEVVVASQFTERCLHNILKVIPLQAQLFICHGEFLNGTTFDWSFRKPTDKAIIIVIVITIIIIIPLANTIMIITNIMQE